MIPAKFQAALTTISICTVTLLQCQNTTHSSAEVHQMKLYLKEACWYMQQHRCTVGFRFSWRS